MRARISLLAVCCLILFPSIIPPAAAAPSTLISKIWGGAANEIGNAVAADAAGNIYITGETDSFGPHTPYPTLFLTKHNANGTLVWQRTWSNTSETARAIALDSAGNIYVTGYIRDARYGTYYALLLKFNSDGSLLWERDWGVSNDFDVGNGLAVDSSANVYLVGETQNWGAGEFDALIMKFTPSGALLWERTWGGRNFERAYAAAVDTAGNLYVGGATDSNSAAYYNQIFLLKLSSSGTFLSAKVIGGWAEQDAGNGIALDNAGHIYVAGQTCNGKGVNCYAILLKLDSSIGGLWQRTWGSSNGTDFGRALAVDSSGEAFVTGETNSYGQGGTCRDPSTCNYLFLIRVSSSGSLLSQLVYGGQGINGTSDGIDLGRGVALDPYGNPIVTGGVREPPPYILRVANNIFGNSSLPITAIGNYTLGNPNFAIRTRVGMVGTPSGNGTWEGTSKALVFKYGSIPGADPLTLGITLSLAGLFTGMIILLTYRAFKRRELSKWKLPSLLLC